MPKRSNIIWSEPSITSKFFIISFSESKRKNNEVLKSSNTNRNKDIEKSIIIGDDDVLKEIKLLGSFKEPERYPESFRVEFFKDCEKFSCIGNTSTKKMAEVFSKSSRYNLKNPGNQIKGMALFEIYYLNVLRKNEKKIEIFLENWPIKKKKTKEVISLIEKISEKKFPFL